MAIVSRRMSPTEANSAGNVFGGAILALCDEAAGIAATRHARKRVVTAAVDAVEFLEPGNIGELLTCYAAVNAAFGSSMEVGVRVEAEDLMTGEVRHTNSAYFVMVALGDDAKPAEVPDVNPSSDLGRQRYEEAQQRQAARKKD